MNTTQIPTDFPEVQAALYGVALSLDSFLLNGIPYGVLQEAMFPGFLDKVAGNLLRDLATLEQHAPDTAAASQAKVRGLLASLRAKCQQLIDFVNGLRSFAGLPLQELRSLVARVPLLRGECVRLIQELEACFHTPKPFYQSRPGHSTASVDDFLASLEQAFVEAWTGANTKTQVTP